MFYVAGRVPVRPRVGRHYQERLVTKFEAPLKRLNNLSVLEFMHLVYQSDIRPEARPRFALLLRPRDEVGLPLLEVKTLNWILPSAVNPLIKIRRLSDHIDSVLKDNSRLFPHGGGDEYLSPLLSFHGQTEQSDSTKQGTLAIPLSHLYEDPIESTDNPISVRVRLGLLPAEDAPDYEDLSGMKDEGLTSEMGIGEAEFLWKEIQRPIGGLLIEEYIVPLQVGKMPLTLIPYMLTRFLFSIENGLGVAMYRMEPSSSQSSCWWKSRW